MCDIDAAITKWRRQMLSAGVQSPELLDELESHLRDDVEHHTRSGLDAQQAFAAAVQRIGPASALKAEFEKDTKAARKRELNWTLYQGMGVLIGLYCVWILNEFPSQPLTFGQQVLGAGACLMFPLIMVGSKYAHRFLPGLPRNRRALVFLLSLAGGLLCTAAVQENLVEPLRDRNPGLFLVAFIWGWAPSVISANVIFVLDEAAYRKLGETDS